MEQELENMVIAAVDQRPTDFNDSFNNIFMDKLQVAINNKKIDFAQKMYGKQVVDDIDLETETEE